MRYRICLIAFISMLTVGSFTSVEAATPGEIAAATRAAPYAANLTKDVVKVPFAAAELLYLPLGASEIVLSPLPGISIPSGVGHIGKGIIAPFKVGILVLKLPFQALEKISSIGSSSPATTRRVRSAY